MSSRKITQRSLGSRLPDFGTVHHYEDINWIVICAIIVDVLPEFLEEIKDL